MSIDNKLSLTHTVHMAIKATQTKVTQVPAKKTWVRLSPEARRRIDVWSAASTPPMSPSEVINSLALKHLPEVPSYGIYASEVK